MAFDKEYWATNHARVLSTICATLSPFTRRSSIINLTHCCAAGLFFATAAVVVVLLEDVDFAFALALAMGSIPFSSPDGCCTSHSLPNFMFHSLPFFQAEIGRLDAGFQINTHAAATVLDLASFVNAMPSGK